MKTLSDNLDKIIKERKQMHDDATGSLMKYIIKYEIFTAIKYFIKKLEGERIRLFKTIKYSGKNNIGLIKKQDWDRFMINCDELAGDGLT